MTTTVLVLNAGSSSLKYKLFDIDNNALLIEGIAERLTNPDAFFSVEDANGKEVFQLDDPSHEGAIKAIMGVLESYPRPVVVGHRVVHGGERFDGPALVNDEVIDFIEECAQLAPLHNRANLTGIKAAAEAYEGVPQVVVFDTAFHTTMPKKAFLYPVPYRLYEDMRIRKYGFHGTSHQYVSHTASELMGQDPSATNVVVAHLGNGSSATAVAGGKSVDTTMGLTPLDGLMMGTRCGSIDPAILLYLMKNEGFDHEQLDQLLNKESGLLGISQMTHDMRDLEDARADGDENATLAIDIFCYRLAKQVAGLAVSLPSLDALIFTGGIGENSSLVRQLCCDQLGQLGIRIDSAKNEALPRKQSGRVDASESSVQIWVVQTDEELTIAEQAFGLVR